MQVLPQDVAILAYILLLFSVLLNKDKTTGTSSR